MISAFSIFRIPTSFFLFVALLNWITPTPVGATHSRLKRSSCRPKRTSDGAALTATFSGKGTHNPDDWGSGNCAFTKWPRPAGFGAVAMASNQWNSSGICGACLEITGSGGTFKGIVGNQCPSCEPNGLDLDTDIWNQVSGHKDFGIIQLTW
ncbi:hypothetical protein PCASD_07724 [Puccinia coronata f. sp. avenae]|uniref:Expansin-like EG45 domain-containing protein n=1 Tax=Puccinia coronata f. sp. avenae TaxID=200324 RepID=A0A2N5UX24_9BASI|nr:hypothetical protein PCASD_07724 [Puccinia coronata f. sp. avenae]